MERFNSYSIRRLNRPGLGSMWGLYGVDDLDQEFLVTPCTNYGDARDLYGRITGEDCPVEPANRVELPVQPHPDGAVEIVVEMASLGVAGVFCTHEDTYVAITGNNQYPSHQPLKELHRVY